MWSHTMKKHVIRKFKRPNTNVEFFPINENIGFYVETTYADTGKLLTRSTYLSDDLLILTNETVFDSEQSYLMWQTDTTLEAFWQQRKAWNFDNSIIDVEKTVSDIPD
jgi:hypothetical protein